MADKTGIEWTDATWNPLRGCSRISEGCRNCYAESVANRFKGQDQPYEGLIAKGGQWNGQIKLVPEKLTEPLRWRRPRRIFVNSMSDLFHEGVPDWYIDKVFAVMALAEKHTFQVLTKRPQRMRDYLSQDRRMEWAQAGVHIWGGNDPDAVSDFIQYGEMALPNVWLGVSVEDQATADERIPLLLQTPVAVRWVSAEPLLEEVTIFSMDGLIDVIEGMPSPLHWVVVGGESGPGARPMHPEWARSLRDQCAAAGVAYLFKQWGEWQPTEVVPGGDIGGDMRKGLVEIVKPHGENNGRFERGDVLMRRVGKKAAGRLLDGVQHDGYPEVATA